MLIKVTIWLITVYGFGLLAHALVCLLDRNIEEMKDVYVYDLIFFPTYIVIRYTMPVLIKLWELFTKKVC